MLKERDRLEVERIGIKAAMLVARNVAGLAGKAWKDRARPGQLAVALHQEIKPFTDILQNAMAAAHLRGRLRAITTASKAMAENSKSLAAYDEALAYYQKRLDLTPDQMRRVIALYGNEAAKVTREATGTLEEKVAQAIKESLTVGEHVAGGVERVREAFQAAGVVPSNSFLLETLVRTQIQIAYSAGEWNALRAPEIQSILTAFHYVTTGDFRVRENHAEMDGAIAAKDHPVWEKWYPPAGHNCRCSCIAIFGEFEENLPDPLPEPDEGFGINFGKVFSDRLP
jgi:SPP1 gp7 family putative phage head morphogenesis protein